LKSTPLDLWREHGGSTHGPNVEHVSMPLSSFPGFCTALTQRDRNMLAAKVSAEIGRSAAVLRPEELAYIVAALIIHGKTPDPENPK
jgi:hypothetical protein